MMTQNNIKWLNAKKVAIGVVYNPEYERFWNYVPTILTKRYDVFLYIDKTHALHSLHMPEVKEDENFQRLFLLDYSMGVQGGNINTFFL